MHTIHAFQICSGQCYNSIIHYILMLKSVHKLTKGVLNSAPNNIHKVPTIYTRSDKTDLSIQIFCFISIYARLWCQPAGHLTDLCKIQQVSTIILNNKYKKNSVKLLGKQIQDDGYWGKKRQGNKMQKLYTLRGGSSKGHGGTHVLTNIFSPF